MTGAKPLAMAAAITAGALVGLGVGLLAVRGAKAAHRWWRLWNLRELRL